MRESIPIRGALVAFTGVDRITSSFIEPRSVHGSVEPYLASEPSKLAFFSVLDHIYAPTKCHYIFRRW